MDKNNFRSGWVTVTAGFRSALSSARSKFASPSGARTAFKFIAVLAVLLPCSLLFCEAKVDAASNIIVVNDSRRDAANLSSSYAIVGDTSIAGDGYCSLREAINNANSIGIDTTGGDCTVGTGTDVINFAPGVSVSLASKLPAIAHNLTIDGGILGIAIDGEGTAYWTMPNATLLEVNSGATLYLANVALFDSNGSASLLISNNGGMLTVSNAYLGGNNGARDIYNTGTVTITNSQVAGSQGGGGITNPGILTVTNSDVYGLQNGGTATATNSTLNGVYNDGTFNVTNSTFLYQPAIINHSGSATFRNSILALPNGGVECEGNPIINAGYNISIDGSCGFGTSTGASGQTIGDNVDPLLDTNANNNGGPTPTVALLPGSPAIAAIPATLCPAADQRGEPRPAAGQTACAIGAVEQAFFPPATITVNTVSDTSTSGDGSCSLREAISNADNPGIDTTGGDCKVGGGDDTIVFSRSGRITLGTALPGVGYTLTIDGSGQTITIDGNGSTIFTNGRKLSIANLTLSRATTAIMNNAALTVANCTFSDNSASNNWGGGGAISNFGDAIVTDSTFSGNGALDAEGGAILSPGPLTISNSTFSGNIASAPDTDFGPAGGGTLAGNIRITNSILSNNIGGNYLGPDFDPFGSTWISGDHNISDDATCRFGASTGASGQTLGDNVDPKLDPSGLQNNGGLTQTIALQPTSPAIGAIPAGSANCPGTDQRGESRPAAGQTGCDVGAFELQGNTPAGTNVTAAPSSTTNLTFASVSTAGMTTATTSTTGPTQPTGFYFGNPATYVDVATTATFSGNITVCNSYDPGQYTDPAHLSLMHFDGSTWVDVTTSNDTVNHIICGQVTSLSPFTVAQKAVCNTTYSGTVKGNLTVTSGSTCIIGGTVTGKVTQTGGRLLASAASIGGNVQILGGDFSIGSGTSIGGNLQISNLSASKLQYQVCSTKVNGNLQLQSNAAVIAVGGSNCTGATVGGNIQVQNNTATTALSRSTAKGNILVMNNNGMTLLTSDTSGGNIEVKSNANVTQIMNNNAAGHLDCTGNNASMVGGPNTANQLQGQCF